MFCVICICLKCISGRGMKDPVQEALFAFYNEGSVVLINSAEGFVFCL